MRSGRRGFTIVELLVAIALIAILIALVMPAVSAAKHQARALVCTSQLRQIGLAWSAYLADSEGAFPVWSLNLHWFYGGRQPSMADQNFEYPTRPLNPYVGLRLKQSAGSRVFGCTEDRAILAADGGPGPTRGHDTHTYYGNSYMMNAALLYRFADRTGRLAAVHLDEVVPPPARVVLAGDCQWYYSILDAPWDAHFHNAHHQVNLVYLDGHASYTQLLPGVEVAEGYSFAIGAEGPQGDPG